MEPILRALVPKRPVLGIFLPLHLPRAITLALRILETAVGVSRFHVITFAFAD
jgi:hypothetical protein